VVEAAQSIRINHDSAMKAIRADEVRRLVGGVWTGATGAGVIVGVYDTGLDFRHDDFLDANGRTRLLGLWDQTRSGTPPPGFALGHYCSQDAIQRVIDSPTDTSPCPEQDSNGHGTHTAGSAAGDGSAGVPPGSATHPYAGVAPMADLIIVKGGNGSFSESNILDGLRWLESQARALNRPMVVNLSLGGQTGAHDGSRLYEQGIDNLSRAGFIVVISAGNEGSNGNVRNRDGSPYVFSPVYIHGSGLAVTGTTREFTFEIPAFTPSAGACNEGVGFNLWYEGQDSLRVTLVRPDGTSHEHDRGAASSQDSPGGNIHISNAPSGPNPNNGAYEVLIQTNDCGASRAAPAAGTWRLRVTTLGTGSGQAFHFWMNQNSLGGSAIARGRLGFDNRYVVGSPGNARTAITVGASAARNCWPSGTTQICYLQVEEIGDLARFSSGGPTRDGRLKPEITAPGIAVVSALSRNAVVATNRITPDLAHLANQGTSMAAPQVTGTVALMLQIRPTLSSAEIRQIFARSAERDAFTSRVYGTGAGAQPSDWWGYGKLQVPRALCELGAAGALTFVSITPAQDTLPQNATLRLEACAVGVAGTLAFESSNPAVATVDGAGVVHALEPGNTLIIARADTSADTAYVTVVPPATVVATGNSAAPGSATLGRARTLLTLLALHLRVNGFESVAIESLGFAIHGADPGARVVLAQDLDGNGRINAADRVISAVARGPGTADTIQVLTPMLTVAQRSSVALLVGLELSGAAANLAQFQISFVAPMTRTLGERSGARDRLEPVTVAITSASATTTVLDAGQVFSLSENPVRGHRVVFSFAERPRTAGIYTLTGRRVLDLTRAIDQLGSVIWDLRNTEGTRVAPGVYLVIFDVGGRLIREKLFVMTPQQ
jgi:subtilisin family serine protease